MTTRNGRLWRSFKIGFLNVQIIAISTSANYFCCWLSRDAEMGVELVEGKETVRCIVSVVNDRDPVTPEVRQSFSRGKAEIRILSSMC